MNYPPVEFPKTALWMGTVMLHSPAQHLMQKISIKKANIYPQLEKKNKKQKTKLLIWELAILLTISTFIHGISYILEVKNPPTC